MEANHGRGGGGRPRSLWGWAVLAAILAVVGYLAGAGLAWRMTPSLALPLAAGAPLPTHPPTRAAALWLAPGVPAESRLQDARAADEWQFQGRAGQSATVEMWLHPGAGSGVDAELAVQLFTADGFLLAEESGSVFLTPYLFTPALPADGLYYVRVAPTAGTPGRYSLLLTLAEASAPGVFSTLPPQRATTEPYIESEPIVSFAPGMFVWPTVSRRISGWVFHDPANPRHIGLDIAANMWDPIVAAAGGVVVFAEWGGGYGNLVVVEHPGGWTTYYAHLTQIVVEGGQEVQQGELLGGAGTTGYSTGTHLHFEIRYQGRPVDPQIYLP